jgi:hypothetical protein
MFQDFGLWLAPIARPLMWAIAAAGVGLVSFLQWRTMSKLRRRAAELEAEAEAEKRMRRNS